MNNFLSDINPRPLNQTTDDGISPLNLYLGKGSNALEIVTFEAKKRPANGSITKAWNQRRAGRATPIISITFYENEVALCGPEGEDPPIVFSSDIDQLERVCKSILDCEDRHSAVQLIDNVFLSLETKIPGFLNQGLFATHTLEIEAQKLSSDNELIAKAKNVVSKKGNEVLTALGFIIEKIDNLTNLLRADNERSAIAVLLNEGEFEELSNERFNNISPVSYALSRADNENLDWAIFIQNNRIRLYSTKNIGVSKRGRSESYFECQLNIVANEDLALLWKTFSAEALRKSGSINELLENSRRFSGELAERLRDRIYNEVIPELAKGITKSRNQSAPSQADISLNYEMALTILFRILFIAYAEDRDLLPYKENENYRKRSLKQKAQELLKKENETISQGSHHWNETLDLFRAIYSGNNEWTVPEYAGSIFSNEKDISLAGYHIDELRIDNIYFEKALKSLITIELKNGEVGPVDFRSLSVREFGTIYEGLLESELSIAKFELAVDSKGNYIPSKDEKDTIVRKGEIYLHNKSGARKSSGSFYTKDFAVEHILDISLEQSLNKHLEKLDTLNDLEASEEFFNFKIADISMGSGHFLVSAIDRIEKSFSGYLSKRPLINITNELNSLKISAINRLPKERKIVIEDIQLLKRLIARRCIYGVDLNSLSVQLAKLSIWIHTFIPGLPLSTLDHSIRSGNSLIGIGSIEEIKEKVDEVKGTLFQINSEDLLRDVSEPLLKFALINEASISDVKKAKELLNEAHEKTIEIKALCNLITASFISDDPFIRAFPFEEWEQRKQSIVNSKELKIANDLLSSLSVFHFPIEFPEVFLRNKKGFDVIIGNPPWQEITVEEDAFWARYFPGLGGLTQREQEEKKEQYREDRPDLVNILDTEINDSDLLRSYLVKIYKDAMSKGDPDLYKAFCIRFSNLIGNQESSLGLVLPRSAFSAAGSFAFRKHLIDSFTKISLTILKNKRRWVFEDVSEQYAFVLLSAIKEDLNSSELSLKGPYSSYDEFLSNHHKDGIKIDAKEVSTWNDTLSFPALPDELSTEVFTQLRKSPRFDIDMENEWRARADSELHATNQKNLMDLKSKECPDKFWPVYKGSSFNLWNPDTKEYYAWADPKKVKTWLQEKRLNSKKSSRDSAHGEFDLDYIQNIETLAANKPRIAFRDISRASDPRTIIACLIPGQTFVTNKAPFLHFPRGSNKDILYLLGVMSSIPFDWYAKRFIEINVNFFIFKTFPIPRPEVSSVIRNRIIEISGNLSCQDERFSDWIKETGIKLTLLNEEQKNSMIYELDALIAKLYNLSEKQLIHIFKTFHEGWDYSERLEKVLNYFREI